MADWVGSQSDLLVVDEDFLFSAVGVAICVSLVCTLASPLVLLLAAVARGDLGAVIIEADDHHVTTVFTIQPSFHHRHSRNRVS